MSAKSLSLYMDVPHHSRTCLRFSMWNLQSVPGEVFGLSRHQGTECWGAKHRG